MDELASYALTDLTWVEVARVLERDPRLLVPVGALEQFGRHLPLGTNTLIVTRLCRDLSRDLGILCAPALSYGVNAPFNQAFPGTASLGRKTLHRTVNELFAGWEDHGVREFVVVTAHRHEPHVDALLMALTSRARTTVVNVYAIDVSDLLRGPPGPQHGGEVETSLMLFLHPDRVRRGETRDYRLEGAHLRRYARGGLTTPPPDCPGSLGHPSLASAATGERLYRRYLETLRHLLSPAPEG